MRGLDIRKPNSWDFVGIREVSVPLRGLDIRKLVVFFDHLALICLVSVPLRGLDIRKLYALILAKIRNSVSVPLRGLDIRKPEGRVATRRNDLCFSPLAGIRYSETQSV